MAFEANLRVQDPVYGCVGIIFQLQQQIIETQSQISKTKCQIAFQQQQQLQQQQISAESLFQSSSQQDPFLHFQMFYQQ